jgi:choline dehydrogenase-like flavoprotein
VIIDARTLEQGGPLRATVVIVGSGAAGTSVALRLARRGIDVLVLEAGGPEAEAAVQDSLRGDTSLAPQHDPLDAIRQKRLGGTTAQWGGRCLPLDAMDLRRRSWIPGSGWPIGPDDLHDSYVQAQALLDLGADEWTAGQALGDAPALLGSDAGRDGFTDDRVWRWSPPARFSRLLTTSTHPTLRVLHHAPVVELLQDRAGGPVTGVRLRPRAGRDLMVHAAHVVLAAGGLETARLLLASATHEPAGVGNAHDQVGRGYMIHPLAEVGRLQLLPGAGSPAAAASFGVSHDGVYVRRLISLNDDVQERLGLLRVAHALWYPDPRDADHGSGLLSSFALVRGVLARRSNDFKATGIHRRYAETPDVGRHVANVVRDLPSVLSYGATWVSRRWVAERRIPSFTATSRDGTYRLRLDAEQSPEPDNRVRLSREHDAWGLPRIALEHHVSRTDREMLHRGLEALAERVGQAGRATLTVPTLDEVLDLEFGDGTHQMGTARMSHSPSTGVVDRDCRVWDVPGLSLAGSSVFSTSGMAGPTLTIVALALRLADSLADSLS